MEHGLDILMAAAAAATMMATATGAPAVPGGVIQVTHMEMGQALGASFLGAAVGGYISALFLPTRIPFRRQTVKNRLAANICCGIGVGPILAVYLRDYLPAIPLAYLGLFSGWLCGVVGVLSLTVAVPYFVKYLKKSLKGIVDGDDHDNDRPPPRPKPRPRL